MDSIKLGPGVVFPLDAVTQTFALLAKRGAGKTYAALKLAESMIAVHAQIVAIDPVGKWWSLRLAADGKKPGCDIPVFGGHHGDLPLEPGAGKLMADLIVDRTVSAVLDVSLMRKSERKTFATAFAEQLLLRKKRDRTPEPLHLFLEESQLFVPQRTSRGEERMLGAFEDLVKLGRNYGIGATLISQRPQAVNKDVLTQTECLIVLQTIGAQERKALRDWMREVGSDRSEVVDELPSLEIGEAYLWSPGWLRTFRKIRIGKRWTFDASATPKLGAKRSTAAPRQLDTSELDELRKMMSEVVERAEQTDPAALRRKVQELQRELSATRTETPTVEPEAISLAHSDGFGEGVESARSMLSRVAERDRKILKAIQELSDTMAIELDSLPPVVRRRATPPPPQKTTVQTSARLPDSDLGGGMLRMMKALASRAPIQLSTAQWATLSKLKKTGGTWGAYTSRLKNAGYVAKDGDLWTATVSGIEAAGEVASAPQTTAELVSMWRSNVGSGPSRMLDVLIEEYPESLDRQTLGERVGITASGGTFGAYLSRLKTNGLVEISDGQITASRTLFDV